MAYEEALKIDTEESNRYYWSSIRTKTEQQKRLEALLRALQLNPKAVADVACGGGGSSFHLAALYPGAHFTLVDANEAAIAVAAQAMQGLAATCLSGDIYALPFEADSFDLVVCWQTLSWIDKPEIALSELVRICRPGARIYASSLFNPTHDVDIFARVEDQTRASSAQGLSYAYNTYSLATVRKWVGAKVAHVQLHEFDMPIDLTHAGKGLGTYTVRMEGGKRLQFSAGMLLNWGILELRK